jgi:hypothetical protein
VIDENFAEIKDLPGAWRVTWTDRDIANVRAVGFVAICWANENLGQLDVTVEYRDATFFSRN